MRSFSVMKLNSFSLCLAGILCLSGFYQRNVADQNSEILSAKPPVSRAYDADKNESTISTWLVDLGRADLSALSGFDPNRPPPDLRLHAAEYTYPGTNPSRPSAISFVLVPLNKYKTGPKFSVISDGSLIHEGDA